METEQKKCIVKAQGSICMGDAVCAACAHTCVSACTRLRMMLCMSLLITAKPQGVHLAEVACCIASVWGLEISHSPGLNTCLYPDKPLYPQT